MSDYFVHESSYIDDDVKIGKAQKSGIFLIFKVDQK